jgi:anti-sigma regulatory factor (Ser/Thr protein kinase)
MVERRFQRTSASLEAIYAFVREFLASRGIHEEVAFDVDLIVEELFTNMVKYGVGGQPEITIGLGWCSPDLTLRLEDQGAPPFDPGDAPPVDVTRPLDERRAGGLGLHLVRRMADRLEYAYEDGRSRITVTKRVEA